jgi:hypothetical protein
MMYREIRLSWHQGKTRNSICRKCRNFRMLNRVLLGFKGLQIWDGTGFKTTELRSRLDPWTCPGVSNEDIHDEQKYTTCIAILILHVGIRLMWSASRPDRFTPRGKRSQKPTENNAGWGPRASLDFLEKRKTSAPCLGHSDTHTHTYIYIYIWHYPPP